MLQPLKDISRVCLLRRGRGDSSGLQIHLGLFIVFFSLFILELLFCRVQKSFFTIFLLPKKTLESLTLFVFLGKGARRAAGVEEREELC
jgi:hypothetical protein